MGVGGAEVAFCGTERFDPTRARLWRHGRPRRLPVSEPDETIAAMARATSPASARLHLVRTRMGTMTAAAATILGCVGCSTTARSPALAPGANANISNTSTPVVGDGNIVVRMAKKDEFWRPPASAPAVDEPRRLHSADEACKKNGPVVRAYYKPLVTFALEHIVGQEHGAVHEMLITADADKPRLRDGVNIIVKPRGVVGELRTVWVGPPFYAPGTRWAETVYCLHVLHEGANTTIAVEESWSMIR